MDTHKRKWPEPREENRPNSKSKTEYKNAESIAVVKSFRGKAAKDAAARAGLLNLLPAAVDYLAGGRTPKIGALEKAGATWVLAILEPGAGWTAYQSRNRAILESINRGIFGPDANTAQWDGGERWS